MMGFPSKTYLYGIWIKVSPIEISGVSVAEHNRFVKRCGPRSHALDEERGGRQSTRSSEVWLKPDPALKGLRMQGWRLSYFWYGANKNTSVSASVSKHSGNTCVTSKSDFAFKKVAQRTVAQRACLINLTVHCRLRPGTELDKFTGGLGNARPVKNKQVRLWVQMARRAEPRPRAA